MIRMISRSFWLSALALVLIFAAAQTLQAAEVKNVRLWTEGGVTRVVLDLDKRVQYNLFPLRAPDRLVIDLEGSYLASNFNDLPSGSGAVRGLRAAKRGADGLRIVLDLDRAARPNSLFAGPVDNIGERLVIDLPSSTTSVTTKQAPPQSALARDLVVAIDPGHGGRDPGAIGRGKTREKDVVLSIARKLARRVDAEPGMSAYLIRSDDTLVDHVERMERARRKNADIFISIHADAFTDKRARGSSVYALSLNGASSEAARRLAASNSDLIGGVDLSGFDPVLASVLMNMSQNAAISSSVKAGKEVLSELKKIGKVHKPKVQQANFAVLRSPDVPSILVETAFITNPSEERKLRDAAHQEKLAAAVLNGVKRYFSNNPPPDTLFARNEQVRKPEPVRYVIARGDTLSEIAERYKVGVALIRSTNKLSSDRVRVGQVLTIPIGS